MDQATEYQYQEMIASLGALLGTIVWQSGIGTDEEKSLDVKMVTDGEPQGFEAFIEIEGPVWRITSRKVSG